jgi:hypothetical protein
MGPGRGTVAEVSVEEERPIPRPLAANILSLVGFSLKAAGAAGVFALIGYIATVAHAELLGIEADLPNLNELSLAAARFWFDSLLIILQQAQVHWLLSLLSIAMFGLVSWPHLASGRAAERFHFASEVGIVASLIAISSLALVFYELPAIQLRDLTTVGLCSQPGTGMAGVVDKGTNRLWSLMLDARDRDLGCSTHPHEHGNGGAARSRLGDLYATTWLTVVAGWLLIYLRQDQTANDWLRSFRTVGVLGLILTSLLIPYVYGKLVWPTTMQTLQVRVFPISQVAKNKDALPRGIPLNTEGWLTGDNFLIRESDKAITVLNFDRGQPSALFEIPRSDIGWLAIPGISDVLVKLIDAQPTAKVVHD